MNLAAFWGEVLPSLLALIATLLGLVIRSAAQMAKQRWGIEIEARHREALHSALMTGITAALTRGLGTQAAIAAALDYAGRSVPDAIAALGPDAETLRALAEAKLRAAIAVPIVRSDGVVVPGIARAGVGTP